MLGGWGRGCLGAFGEGVVCSILEGKGEWRLFEHV